MISDKLRWKIIEVADKKAEVMKKARIEMDKKEAEREEKERQEEERKERLKKRKRFEENWKKVEQTNEVPVIGKKYKYNLLLKKRKNP